MNLWPVLEREVTGERVAAWFGDWCCGYAVLRVEIEVFEDHENKALV